MDGLVGVLNEKIDSIRRAVDDEMDEDDSGYMDEWDDDLWLNNYDHNNRYIN